MQQNQTEHLQSQWHIFANKKLNGFHFSSNEMRNGIISLCNRIKFEAARLVLSKFMIVKEKGET